MTKFHINAKGVPAPCKATKGNCPFGGASGQDNHYDTIEKAQAAADKKNEQEHGFMPSVKTTIEIKKEGKHLANLIDKRKNKIKEPDLPGKSTFYAINDIDDLLEVGNGGYITTQEHDPIQNANDMFDYLEDKKLYRYAKEGENPLDNYNDNFEEKIDNLKYTLEQDYYMNSKYDNPEFKPTEEDLDSSEYAIYEDFHYEPRLGKNTPTEIFNEDLRRHNEMRKYTKDLALEYATDYEKKVQYGNYSQEEQKIIANEYKKAMNDKIGQFISNYTPDNN